ncbi:MAG TPA: hypothetical protein VJJ75_02360 [Candidatus Nanoarchaeia archaeon]|nr:hypothetical protein [Candidatus Woesearchaeota archaeon]HLC55355.1 hypothetical protein [Candidatus Nanoarchaeia archaeon]
MEHTKDSLRNLAAALILISVLALLASMALAAPQGPNVINISNTGRNPANTNPISVQAEAGNVTELVIDGTRVTMAWQGYLGNITGIITLDDADNFTLYDWNLPDPSGEIYASNGSSVTWTRIFCINVSQNGSTPIRPGGIVSSINGSQIEMNFGINITDPDGLNETFTSFYNDTEGFQVGTNTINNADGCSLAHSYTNEASDANWNELLLSDNSSLIFTALLRQNANSYKPGAADTADFQMLVLENGHEGHDGAATPYYFYVELE